MYVFDLIAWLKEIIIMNYIRGVDNARQEENESVE